MDSIVDWQVKAKCLLKAQLAFHNVNYVQLAELLKEMGIDESPQNISNKIARGTFSAVFFIQCLFAIRCDELPIK